MTALLDDYEKRVNAQITALRREGKKPAAVDVSVDVLTATDCIGINHSPGSFVGLPIRAEITHLTNYILVVPQD